MNIIENAVTMPESINSFDDKLWQKAICICDAIPDKSSNLVVLKAKYEAFILERNVVTEHVIALTTTARLEALDLALIRWEVACHSEIKVLEGVCTSAIPCGSQGWLDQR